MASTSTSTTLDNAQGKYFEVASSACGGTITRDEDADKLLTAAGCPRGAVNEVLFTAGAVEKVKGQAPLLGKEASKSAVLAVKGDTPLVELTASVVETATLIAADPEVNERTYLARGGESLGRGGRRVQGCTGDKYVPVSPLCLSMCSRRQCERRVKIVESRLYRAHQMTSKGGP